MRIGFFTVFRHDPQHYVLGAALIRSVRAVMPEVPVIQLTDDTSPPVLGVDSVVRLPSGPMLERRIEHYAACEGDWLLVDTDVQVRQDVRSVFTDSFDVAVTDRFWSHLPQSREDWVMPFNTGVVFSRSPAFWQRVLEEWKRAEATDWMSEQRAVYQAVRSGLFRVKILPGMIYNYPPKDPVDLCKDAALVHYKGPRKEWLRG
jgi:hypothetical protein